MNLIYSKQQFDIVIQKKGISIQSYLEAEREIILTRAEQLQKNIFVFDKTWDMERCIIPFQLDPLDFKAQRNDDEEWTFMLNRMDYLCYLIEGYVITEKKAYLETCKYFIFEWIAQHNEITSTCSTRTLDTAIRCVNMMDALCYLYAFDYVSDKEIVQICNCILKQIDYMFENYVHKYTLSNWGSIQTCAIASLLVLLAENYKENRIYQWTQEEMKKQFAIQVYEDGMFWEQSTMYHVEVLNYGLRLLSLYNCLAIVPQTLLHEKVYALAQALYLQATPDLCIEAFGDSDRCNIQDVMCRCSFVFQDGTFKNKAYAQFDAQSVYELGSNAAQAFEQIHIQKDLRYNFDGIQSGMYTHISDLSKRASFSMFTHGSLGSGHGHCDNLHLSLYYQGKPFLIDNGRYTYREDSVLRTYLKSMPAHNTMVIDDKPMSVAKQSWDNEKFALVLKPYFYHNQSIHYYEGVVLDDQENHTIIRKLFVIDPSIWFVCDSVIAKGKHEIKQYFHFDPKVNVENKNVILLQNEDVKLHMHSEQAYDVNTTECSLRYNELQMQQCIITNTAFVDEANLVNAFCDSNFEFYEVDVYQEQKVAPKDLVCAYKFVVDKKESYVCIVFHKEVHKGRKIFYCEGVAFHAKSIVLHSKEQVVTQYVCKA